MSRCTRPNVSINVLMRSSPIHQFHLRKPDVSKLEFVLSLHLLDQRTLQRQLCGAWPPQQQQVLIHQLGLDHVDGQPRHSIPHGARQFRFIEGPVFCQLLMADEINRASPRTQSALLQAMQEKSVTVAGRDRPLGVPFHVLATQNPIEQEGTYPLPEAQLDRFLLEIQVPYPDRATERDILLATTGAQEAEVSAVFDPDQLLAAQALIRRMPVGEAIVELILDLVRAFRPEDPTAPERVRENMRWGPGPRAAQALMLAVRARALLRGAYAPSAQDVADLAPAVLNHRMALAFGARASGITQLELIGDVTQMILDKKAAS